MKKIIICVLLCLPILLSPKTTYAQGTTYLSNLGQTSAGSLAIGSDSWYAEEFFTENNTSGYALDSVQLEMVEASDNPSDFMVMLYTDVGVAGPLPGSSLGTLAGSLNPATAGIFTYTPASNLTLSPNTSYFIVLTAGTTVANGAYEWSYSGTFSYNPSDGWGGGNHLRTSSNGSSWNEAEGTYPQFAINATPIPEPGVLSLLGLGGLGGLGFLWHRRKAKAV